MSLARFRNWLQAEGLGHAYLSNPVSVAYLTGFRTDPGERVMGLVVTPERACLLVPSLELEAAQAAARAVEVAGWRDGEDAYGPLEPVLAGVSEIAVEKEHLSLARAEELTRRFGWRRLLDASPALRHLRLVKELDEVERVTAAARLTDQVTDEAMSRLRAGLSELEVAGLISSLLAEAGARLSFETIVQSGPNSGLPHLRPTQRRLRAGDLVLLDLGALYGGYHGDITRMAVLGSPSDRQREVHDAVLRAHDAAIAAVRPGIRAGEVDEAARRVLREAGLGEHFVHRVGHGLGLEGHEAPSLDPGSALRLEPGMVMTIEPGAYIPAWGGVRIEDDLVVERDGARLLTSASRSLRVVAGT